MKFSPLFKIAGQAMKAAAAAEFRRTSVGQLLREVDAVKQGKAVDVEWFLRTIARRRNFDPGRVLREAAGTTFGELVGAVKKYGKGEGGSGEDVRAFLEGLGPAGKMLGALVSDQGADVGMTETLGQALGASIKVLQRFGFEMLPPKGLRGRAGDAGMERAIQAASQFLEDLGYTVSGPGKAPRAQPTGAPWEEEGAAALPRPAGPEAETSTTGAELLAGEQCPPLEMNRDTDSNVYAYGYIAAYEQLYVQYRWKSRDGQRTGMGSVYKYLHVKPDEYQSLREASSKGSWVWDTLRERGTVVGHRKPYFLVAIAGGYVPRQARFSGTATAGAEIFEPRNLLLAGGRRGVSRLGLEPVRPWAPLAPISPGMKPLFGV